MSKAGNLTSIMDWIVIESMMRSPRSSSFRRLNYESEITISNKTLYVNLIEFAGAGKRRDLRHIFLWRMTLHVQSRAVGRKSLVARLRQVMRLRARVESRDLRLRAGVESRDLRLRF
jgi:hypothetical protein